MRAPRSAADEPKRLVKVWLPPDIVRQMDDVIRATRAYDGRDDFLLEALRDRIKEETLGRAPAPAKPRVVDADGQAQSEEWQLGLWESRAARTAPALKSKGILNGLHNRDFPTLWAADLLASWTVTRGEPVSWMAYVGRLSSSAWQYADELVAGDEERSASAMKAAIGFPRTKNPGRRSASEQRFIEHMVGNLRQGNAHGPIFALGLAGLVDPATIAPTKAGLKLLRSLAQAGIGPSPPHPIRAWIEFRDHIARHLPEDLELLWRMLRAISECPSPERLVGSFADEWQGAIAQTNVSGYVSRAREWGLVAPRLVENQYRLTELGQAELAGKG